MVVVKCTVRTQEETPDSFEGDDVLVESHWNRPALVRITAGGKTVVVSAAELIAAVKNATNTAKY